jgi:transcriptional regulator with GAF, ATPase, and Fis domain
LIEAELFGHTRGAFTGAVGERAGLFEDADGGTLFLDEIGELSARAQAKLLRVLQDGEVRRVGENLSRRVDVRIIAATNRRLEQEAAAGRFRSDLRFRLDVIRIEVPPLRDRASDVPLLASRFWTEAAGRVGSRATLGAEAVAALARYEWPGNVRELQNVIAWIAVQSPHRGRVGPAALPAHIARTAASEHTTFEAARQEFERRFVQGALAKADGQRARAAAALGITRQGLAKMMRRLGIE